MKDLSNEIRAYALRNALEFGKADVSKVLPKLFQHGLEKENIKLIMPIIKRIVDEVNSIPIEEREIDYAHLKSFVKEREEKERTLAEIPNVTKKMIFRIAPFPNGALHLGHAKTFVLNSLYAEKYKGKLILVMDDTIGSAEKPLMKEAYKLIEEGLDYLKINYDKKIIYKSDRLKIYYKYAEKLIKKDKAYVCHCKQGVMAENRKSGKACGCRFLPVDVQLLRWQDMFKATEGDAVLRIKTDMLHKNPAFRDRVLFKISDREHVRIGKKYRVWPTLEMSWAIDDQLLGITHIIRGNDLYIESDMEKYIWGIFNWKHLTIIHTGFVSIEGVKIAKSKSAKEIKSGRFIGIDDPRTWSVQSLKRRGILGEAIRKFVFEIGLNKQNIRVPIESLYAINRRIIDADAKRFSFVTEPVKLDIKNAPSWNEIEIQVHPDKNETRKINLNEIFISKEDFKKYNGKKIRLLHLYNIKLGQNSEFISIDDKTPPKIHWVSENFSAKVLMSSGEWVSGIVDSGISKLKKGEIIQFERFGFVRFDSKNKSDGKEIYDFWFAHK